MPADQVVTDFRKVYAAEYREIKGLLTDSREPSAADGMTGLALSGGGIRSAAFCLGVLQALNAAGVLRRFDYLSTVSGGGYIGSSMTVAMSAAARANGGGWHFPFGKTGQEVGETDETRHLRDNSRYLLQNGAWSAISAGVIYLRGITMNVLIVLPFLLIAAALLVLFKPDTRALAEAPAWLGLLPDGIRTSGWPLSICALFLLGVLLIIYAVGVSISPIQRKSIRTGIARFAVIVLVVCAVPMIFEIHFALLRVMVGAKAMGIAVAGSAAGPEETHWFDAIGRIVIAVTPIVVAILPFVRQIAQKAVTAATESFADAASKWTSRVVLIVVAAIVPLLLWISVLQFAYWGIGVTACTTPEQARCAAWGGDSWSGHAPAFLAGHSFYWVKFASLRGAGWIYLLSAVLLFLFWLFLNVNANSLHQLYRDRLGSAFLFGQKDATGALEGADHFRFSDIISGASPYHLINAALNLPGSNFANRRGRNADFFIFSKRYVGSEATGYVDTRLAEKATDGLNVGTAMAISGAAAAPNMGMASMRPLSATIALLNVRLGRWIRHPLDIVKYADANLAERWWRGSAGPLHLLSEAFFKSGKAVTERRPGRRWAGFLFLTDGGHIENLGIYELLRRRCSLIVAVDAEADPDYTSASLIQLQRFARIDLGTRIVMDWQPIGVRTKEASRGVASGTRTQAHGPHVALGLIDYPPLWEGGDRQRGVLVYIKSSLSGDENDYVMAYKSRNPAFPQESTMEQLFSEEQFEAYRALGEHIGRRLCDGADPATVPSEARDFVLAGARDRFPNIRPLA
ncbi:hypothetical protein AYJ54_26660 [Bradyrhizobium centrolobii]|uniref:PNPLA domain-containing protein n=1 Tax=Bradyrhizobium centrolobii TaxID=1505087 RepID=A0A176YEM6_9BRAD|nr:patatin-like phospholipase family protein [Bradyrhizobium centrolobii]OAF02564.1 hypothetical protein AYJ54_26660 [Bradyrhizobium centrolobii]